MARAAGPVQVGRTGGEEAQPQQSIGNKLFGVMRMVFFWYFVMQMFGGKRQHNNNTVLTDNLFAKGEGLDFWVYLAEAPMFSDFGNENMLIWHEANLPYAEWTPSSVRRSDFSYHLSKMEQSDDDGAAEGNERPARFRKGFLELLHRSERMIFKRLSGVEFQHGDRKYNGTIYAHVYFARSGYSPDPKDPEYDELATFSAVHPLIIHTPKPKAGNRKSLLGKDDLENQQQIDSVEHVDDVGLEESSGDWVALWKPNMTVNLVADFTRYPRGGVAQPISEYLQVDDVTGNYYPVIYFNEFWLLRDKYIQVNESVESLSLSMEVGPISLTRWQLYLQVDQSFQIHRSYGSMIEGEADELKRVFLEGNPVLLIVTMIVSLLHTVFDMLAFKNDIQFWNKNKSMEGLSARSVVVNFICQFIVFLYLMDNETSWMILLSSGLGCCIEFWKIGKAMHIDIDRSRGFPLLRFRNRESYAGNKTKEYDDLAMKYLSYLLYPIVAGFAIYSLKYEQHKSWYSWILSSLTSCVYTFGFIMMCPQLFINYKLKSVAHMPWRQMTYKFLNTIVDDLFAFVIKMPWLHRLSVFRDDIVFLVFVYQKWVYPVDKKRVNEFGFGGAESEEGEAPRAVEGAASEVIERAGDDSKTGRGMNSVSEESMRRTAAGVRVSEASDSSSAEAADNKKSL